MKRTYRALYAPLLIVCSCAPSSQIFLYVDTDAPVRLAPSTTPDAPRGAWLFDRLRIDVMRSGEPPTQSRDFAIDEELFAALKVSAGIALPLADSAFMVRVRLFRGDRIRDGEPPQSATLDTTVRLPSLDETSRSITVSLHTDDVGRRIGYPEPVEPIDGAPTTSAVGTWAHAASVACTIAPGPDEVCVPGGAFWMGDPEMVLPADGVDAVSERLVVVAPFLIEKTEVTIGAFRKKFASINSTFKPSERDPSQNFTQLRSWCVWTTAPAGLEDLPINCIARETAEAYCKSIGKTLPTEAQYEFVSSGLGRELAYPWGNDPPDCPDAVWGLGRYGGDTSATWSISIGDCRASSDFGGVRPPGTGVRDRLALAGGEIVDLGGNVSEWTRDRYSDWNGPFWGQAKVFVDPVADAPSEDGLVDVLRGGAWTRGGYSVRAGYREGTPRATGISTGMRCVRPAK